MKEKEVKEAIKHRESAKLDYEEVRAGECMIDYRNLLFLNVLWIVKSIATKHLSTNRI